ncbi:uncharacterized protein FIBRA_04866 [Fibroporia radiculosa]|uniref:DH domain-containing protein n=1 Tax=Fibroporia radiculosa TaxID=599839 RepID=J4G830_9APHY|nr:uncharacterized protein FIBRA_04866 [Fibroporia radiculosa]CCM02758.1 predicted protein [Fibroporia radiculosa]
MAAVSTPASMVDFPSSESHLSPSHSDIHFQRQRHLPFRRISLPTPPNLNRQSVVSTASFDSLPEEDLSPGFVVPVVTPAVIKNATRPPRHRPSSLDISRRAPRRSHMQPVDEQREAKRRKVINEFHETEKSYLDGLELIYSHFLTPIVASLDTPHQLLDRSELTSIFSNFIDIWNLHRSFYASLTAFLDTSALTQPADPPPPLSPVLLAHFPYLSLYTPFVTSFSDALASYASLLSTHHTFASFIAKQESDPRCGKLRFRDWLLTIVQRCPRYLLLLKDLISCTNSEDPEYAQLTAVHTLVSKITSSLNASLHSHAQTLALLALQRNTANLPFRLIVPGRTFLKRSPLLHLEGSVAKEREFLLFSDCVIWLASADGDATSEAPISVGGGRPPLVRTRSKSDTDTPAVEAIKRKDSMLKFKLLHGSPKKKMRHSSTDERWVYKGFLDLMDVEVVVTPAREPGEERRFELLSPQQSFAVYASNEEERDEWSTAIRNAKSALLVSLNMMQPNSTLTSSSSTNHLRRTLQALPYPPEEKEKPKRAKVEHFVPAIWIPDGKAQSYYADDVFAPAVRANFQTFFVLDDSSKDGHKPARACDACYETVFPLLDMKGVSVPAGTIHSRLTLSGLKSMPSLMLSDRSGSSPSALMAIDVDNPRRILYRMEDEVVAADELEAGPSVPAIRIKPASRPRSYIQILEDFQEHNNGDPFPLVSPSGSRFSVGSEGYSSTILDERDEELAEDAHTQSRSTHSPSRAVSSLPPTPRRENTARRGMRFSLPAVALQTNPVTARQDIVGEGSSRRFSLVLSRGDTVSRGSSGEKARSHGSDWGFREGLAAIKLSELLGRMKGSPS